MKLYIVLYVVDDKKKQRKCCCINNLIALVVHCREALLNYSYTSCQCPFNSNHNKKHSFIFVKEDQWLNSQESIVHSEGPRFNPQQRLQVGLWVSPARTSGELLLSV